MKSEMNESCAVMEFLESAKEAAMEVKRLHRRLDELADQRSGLHVRSGAVARRLIGRIQTERKRESALVAQELESYQRVESFITRIPDRMHRMILRRRYLDTGAGWTEIQELLEKDGVFYSQRHLRRLHGEALEEARRLWNKEREEGMVEKRR